MLSPTRMNRLLTLVLLAFAAWLVALAASFVIELKLTDVTRHADKVVAPRPAAPRARLELDRVSGLFGFRPAALAEVAVEQLPSRFDARLVGTMIDSQRPSYSLAMIRTPGTLAVATYALGDLISGAEVVAIDHSRVYVRDEGQLRFIDGATDPTVADSRGSARRRSENAIELDRTEVSRAMASLASDPKRPTLTPVFDHGLMSGVRVVIQPGTVYATLNLQSGDVIRRVNGQDIETLFTRMRSGDNLCQTLLKSQVEVEFEREGVRLKPITYFMK